MSLELDIHKHFPSFELDVQLHAGDEVFGLLGASGCGKSLTMRSIAGIETPDSGRIVVNGRVFFDSEKKINLSPQERKTALLFQNYMLFPNLTVEQNVAAGIPKGTPVAERNAIVAGELERFEVAALAKRYPAQLSGGQQQRVALARMLAARPCILMLDEPFSALDSHLKSVLEQNLGSLFDAFDGTILYVSHDIDEAFRFCDRIAVVEAGHIMEVGPKRDVVLNPSSLAAIKLSGCKNTTPAEYVSKEWLRLPEWGVTLRSGTPVPKDIAWVGVRELFIRRAEQPGTNVFPMVVDRVSDSRYERNVMLSFLHNKDMSAEASTVLDDEDAARFMKMHLQWHIDKLTVPEEQLPEVGDEVLIHIPDSAIWMVSK